MDEPYLTMCSLFARAHLVRSLYDPATSEAVPGDTVSEKSWSMFATVAVDMLSCLAAEDHFEPESPTLDILSRYLRASTYYASLLTQVPLAPFTIRRKAVTALALRVASEETVDVSLIPRQLGIWVQDFQRTVLAENGPRGKSPVRLFMLAD